MGGLGASQRGRVSTPVPSAPGKVPVMPPGTALGTHVTAAAIPPQLTELGCHPH